MRVYLYTLTLFNHNRENDGGMSLSTGKGLSLCQKVVFWTTRTTDT